MTSKYPRYSVDFPVLSFPSGFTLRGRPLRTAKCRATRIISQTFLFFMIHVHWTTFLRLQPLKLLFFWLRSLCWAHVHQNNRGYSADFYLFPELRRRRRISRATFVSSSFIFSFFIVICSRKLYCPIAVAIRLTVFPGLDLVVNRSYHSTFQELGLPKVFVCSVRLVFLLLQHRFLKSVIFQSYVLSPKIAYFISPNWELFNSVRLVRLYHNKIVDPSISQCFMIMDWKNFNPRNFFSLTSSQAEIKYFISAIRELPNGVRLV